MWRRAALSFPPYPFVIKTIITKGEVTMAKKKSPFGSGEETVECFYNGAVFHIPLDGIDGYDGLVVIMERIVISGHVAPDTLDLC